MTDLRTAAQQALEALRHVVQQAQENLVPTIHYGPVHDTMNNLRAALAQQAEPLNLRDPAVQKRLVTQWGYVPAAQAEPNISRCPQCNGPADNGFDRSIPPNPYLCTKCIAEPVEPVEPVAWMFESERNFNLVGYGGWEKRITECRPNALQSSVRNVTPLYTAPPQRKLVPLTEEEIDRATAQARDALLDHIYEYSTTAEGVLERIRNLCRAVEQAVWEKNNG